MGGTGGIENAKYLREPGRNGFAGVGGGVGVGNSTAPMPPFVD